MLKSSVDLDGCRIRQLKIRYLSSSSPGGPYGASAEMPPMNNSGGGNSSTLNHRHSKHLVSQSTSSLTIVNDSNNGAHHNHHQNYHQMMNRGVGGDYSMFSEYEFTQFHLMSWPDHGVPDSIEPVMQILSIVRQRMSENNRQANEQLNKFNASKSSAKKCHMPLSNDYLLVHCSAGCGRTGTIIAIDQIWNLLIENVTILLVF